MIMPTNPSDSRNQFTNAQLLIHTLHILLIMELYIILSILTIIHSIRLNLPPSLTLSPNSIYQLQSSEADGPVTYRVDWLPRGITLNADQIQVHSSTIQGVYAVRVWATDARGAVDMQIIAINIEQQEAQETQKQIEPPPQPIQKVDAEVKVENQSLPIFSANNNEKQENIISEDNQQKPLSQPQQFPSSDSELRGASQRHQNAIKSITNLLHIIDRQKTKKSQINQQLQKDIKNYEIAVKQRKYLGLQMGTLQRKAKQKQQDIANYTVSIQNINKKLNSLTLHKRQKETQKQQLLAQKQGMERKKQTLTQELTAILQTIQQQHQHSADKSLQCSVHQTQLNQSTHKLNEIKSEHQELKMKQQQIHKLLKNKQNNVLQLRRQLEQAERQLSQTQTQLNHTITQQQSIHKHLSEEERVNQNYKQKSIKCQAQHQEMMQDIQLKQTNKYNIQTKINEVKASMDDPSIQSLTFSISYSNQQIQNYTQKLINAQDSLQSLKMELATISKQLDSIYTQVDDLNLIVGQLHHNIQQLNDTHQQQSRIIDEATLNLEKARSQEIVARANLQSIMSSLSDAAPYVIVSKQQPIKEPITLRISPSHRNKCERNGREGKVRGKVIAILENGFDIKLASGFILQIRVDECTKASKDPRRNDEVVVYGRNKSWYWVAREIVCVK